MPPASAVVRVWCATQMTTKVAPDSSSRRVSNLCLHQSSQVGCAPGYRHRYHVDHARAPDKAVTTLQTSRSTSPRSTTGLIRSLPGWGQVSDQGFVAM